MVLSGLVVALYATFEREGFVKGFTPKVFLLIFMISSWLTCSAFLFYRRVRRLGWKISLPAFLLHFEDLPHGASTRVPPRDDFAALPAWESQATEMQNLVTAALYAAGTPEGTHLVTVFQSEQPELCGLVTDFLRSEGLHPVHTDMSHGGAYRFGWGSRVEVPAVEAKQAEALVRERYSDQTTSGD